MNAMEVYGFDDEDLGEEPLSPREMAELLDALELSGLFDDEDEDDED